MSVETPSGHQSSAWRLKEHLEPWECSFVEKLCETRIQDSNYPENYNSVLASWPLHLETNPYL